MMQDFRFKGFPSHSMQSPRQPVTALMSEDKRRNEENFVRVFGKSSVFDPAKPRIDEGHRGLQYGSEQIDNFPRARGFQDPSNGRSSAEMRRLRDMRSEAQDDITRYKQEKQMLDFHRDEDKKRQKGHDLFLDTLGGPGGTVVRQDGGPSLQSMWDPRLPAHASGDITEQETRIMEQRRKIEDLKRELEFLKSPRSQEAMRGPAGGNDRYEPAQSRYEPSFGRKDSPPSRQFNAFDYDQPRPEEMRSLDLEATRGGAGAPVRDDRGKPITRFPVTMERDDYGTTRIQEHIPGKQYVVPPDPVYDPFGRPGGGAPVVDKYGKRNTHTFGNFESKGDSADRTKRARAQEVMLNELRYGMREQKRNKEELIRYQKAPYGELAEVIRTKEVGQPKRDPITGTLANQHLPNSDVSRYKMNYQPVEDSEKRKLHGFLREQMEEAERSRHLDKLRERQESNKHFKEFDEQWGALGGGAPKDRVVRKKVNLDNALYHFDRQANYPSYQKRYLEEDVRHRSNDATPRFVKTTMQSTSSNLYEYPTDKSPRADQTSGAPYAHVY